MSVALFISLCRRSLVAASALALFLLAGCDATSSTDDDPEMPVPLTVNVYADGFVAPAGVAVDDQGRLWVAEVGSAQNDGRISVVLEDGTVAPVLTGLPSEIVDGEPSGPWAADLQADGSLLIVQGVGTSAHASSLLTVDAAQVAPGGAPLTVDAATVATPIGSYLTGEGFAESNPYALTVGPDGDLFIVDAAANAVVRRDAATGALSVFAVFEDLPNPTPVGPPTINAVPTDIVFADDRFYVSSLTGFPFPDGAASIYEVDLQGNVSVYRDGFTALTALEVDARDGRLLALQFAAFSLENGGWQPGTGQVMKIHTDSISTVVDGLVLTSGLGAGAEGELFVSSIATGEVLRVTYPE